MTQLPLLRDLVVVFAGSLVVVLVFHRLRLPSGLRSTLSTRLVRGHQRGRL